MSLSESELAGNPDISAHQVLIVGGGPTGLMLAAELALAGVDVAIIERRASQHLAGMRAGGLHMRTLEVLDQRGIGDRFVSQGERHQIVPYNGMLLEVGDVPSRRNYFLGLPQNQIERVLADWAEELKVTVYRDREVATVTLTDTGVEVATAGGERFRADYVVGCDGARSVVRKSANIEFTGWDPTKSWLIAEVEWSEEPPWGVRQADGSAHVLGKMAEPELVRIVLTEKTVKEGRNPTLAEVSEALVAIYGTDFGIHSPSWISRFTDRCRQAVEYRKGRILLAGDAAHIHPPMGGQGLNLGVQDAVNLGWKLAQVVKGVSPDSLLDTYHSERYPVAARVLLATMADVALQRQDEHTKALGVYLAELSVMEGPRQHIIGERSGLGIRLDLGEGHPLLGRRLPDLDLKTDGRDATAYQFLQQGRPVLFNFARPALSAPSTCGDRVDVVQAEAQAPWELPVVGRVEAPEAVLVRPDGYVAWVGDATGQGLETALNRWFGVPIAE